MKYLPDIFIFSVIVAVCLALRWYCGIDIAERTPENCFAVIIFSIIGYLGAFIYRKAES
jgi:hypothetical protein